MLMTLLAIAVVAATTAQCNLTCKECAASLECAWCLQRHVFVAGGSLVGRCAPLTDNATTDSLCFTNRSDTGCLCGPTVVGCQSCQQQQNGCGWCGSRQHRGIGFCYNATVEGAADCIQHLQFIEVGPACPVAGVRTYLTWLVSVGIGVVLTGVVAFITHLQSREHTKRAPRPVSSLFVDTTSDGESRDEFASYQIH